LQLGVKRLKISSYGIGAIGIISFAILLRIVLTALGWPPTNSDESAMGIMGIHIATLKDFPFFLYGKHYMGAVEPSIAAGLYHIFGTSLFTLRLADILLFTVAIISMYLLAGLLYTKKLALVTIGLLSIGSVMMIFTELMAHGGYPEVFALGTLAFALVSYLALTSHQYHSPRRKWGRMLAFAVWGFAVAIGFWGDYIMVSIILTSGLVLLLFCWRELLRGAIVPLLLGLLIGAIPLLIYNFTAPHSQSTLAVIWALHSEFALEQSHNPVYPHLPLLSQLRGTLLVSLPMATGAPSLCFDSNWVLLGRGGNIPAYYCLGIHGNWGLAIFGLIWSAGFLFLLALSILHELKIFWKVARLKEQAGSAVRQRAMRRHGLRLILLGNAALTLLEFVLSPVPGVFPTNGRYLLALLISAPALIAPLWGLAHDNEELKEIAPETPPAQTPPTGSAPRSFEARLTRIRLSLRVASLLFIASVFLAGTISIFFELPTVQATDQRQQKLIHDLLRINVTHFYSDYWSCYQLAFLSKEQLICDVMDSQMQAFSHGPKGYYDIVTSDPHSAYVFPAGNVQLITLARQSALNPGRYRHFALDGYVIYQPVATTTTGAINGPSRTPE
jgi:Dolichyl-phosphate-mannose-protein mannosyltransferase